MTIYISFFIFLFVIHLVNTKKNFFEQTLYKLESLFDKKSNVKVIESRICKICNSVSELETICGSCIKRHQINENDLRYSLDITIETCLSINEINRGLLHEFNKEFFLQNLYSKEQVLSRCKTGRDFEELINQIFLSVGVVVKELTRRAADGGKDLIIEMDNDLIYVECKRYTNQNVGSESVRKLAGAMLENDVGRGMIITTSGFTADARAIKNLSVELYTWPEFINDFVHQKVSKNTRYDSICVNIHCQGVVQHNIEEEAPMCSKCKNIQTDFHISLLKGRKLLTRAGVGSERQIVSVSKWNERTCPTCGSRLKEVSPGRYSKIKFKKFIGCSNYPKCRYSRQRW
jgi:ssDNA-binding Zn-finger/Zn-ribbon topoisomerase 1